MRITEPGTPYITAGDSSKYLAVNDGSVRAIKSEGVYIPALLTGSIVGIIALSILSFSISTIVINKRLQMSEDPCPGDWGDIVELGDGAMYCTAENWNYYEGETIKEIETAENRFKITYKDRTSEYRWELLDHKPGLVVIGEALDDGYVSCRFYFAESELPDNFGTNDLLLGEYSYNLEPSWCNNDSMGSEEVSYSSDGPHPFLGVKMYNPMYVGYNDELLFEVTTNTSVEYGSYMAFEVVEYVIEEEIIIGMIMLFVSFLIMLKIDQRRFVLKFDVEGGRMSLRRSMTSTRWGGWSWTNVNYSSAELEKHQSSVRLMMKINGKKHLIADFNGKQASHYVEPLKKLLNIPDTRVRQAGMCDNLPSLDMFDVSNWDSDEDAKHIYEFYIEELGSTDHAKTLDELYEGARLTSLSDPADAQKLLNHVIELLDPGFGAPEFLVHQTRIVEYQSSTNEEESLDESPDSVQLDAFWTSGDSEGN